MKKTILSTAFAIGLVGSVTTLAAETPISASSILADSDGSMIITDTYNHQIWQLENGEFTVIAGALGATNADGTPSGSYRDGTVEEARFFSPWDIVEYGDGYAISDSENHRIRLLNLENGTVELIAGSDEGYSNGTRRDVEFNRPTGLAVDEEGNVYISDSGNHVIRKMDTDGKVTLFAGTPNEAGRADGDVDDALFNSPTGLEYENGILYVADTENNRICAIEDGVVTTLTGSTEGIDGFINGKNALFSAPIEVIANDGELYISDSGNGAVRKIVDGRAETVILTGGFEDGLSPVNPVGLALVDDELYIADSFTNMVNTLDLSANNTTFSDVNASDWFASAVAEISADKIVNGTGGGEFSPNSTVNRAMFITSLSRVETALRPNTVIDGSVSFSDLEANSYYEKAAKWAAFTEIAQGDGDRFLPNDSLTRAQCVTFLYRYGIDLGMEDFEVATLDEFSDASSLPDWSVQAMQWAVSAGIVKGTDEGLLAPDKLLTRAEMAVILDRFIAQF